MNTTLKSIDEVVPIDDFTPSQFKKLMDRRGGCRCCVCPPCFACTEPLTYDECEMVGYEVKPADSPEGAIDYMSITRDFCK